MPETRYQQASQHDVLQWLANGVYRVDLATAQVFNRKGEELAPRNKGGRRAEYWQIRLYHGGKKITLGLSILVWIAGTNTAVPKWFEIHHRDENPGNNAFSNLLCLHCVDHRKVHLPEGELEEAPF